MAKSTPHPRKWEAKGVNSRMYWKSLYLQEVRIRPVEAECHSLETEVAGNPLSNLAYRTALDIVALQRYCGSAHPLSTNLTRGRVVGRPEVRRTNTSHLSKISLSPGTPARNRIRGFTSGHFTVCRNVSKWNRINAEALSSRG